MKKRSFIAALAMLVVSAIVLTSATFAWFSMGDTVTVSSFNASVADATGLTISATGTGNWGSSISLSDISAANQATSLVSSTMFPVSTDGQSTVYSAHLVGATKVMDEGDTSGFYYDFPVYIRYEGDSTATIYLTGTTITNATDNAAGKDPVKAARLAVYKDNETAPNVFVPSATNGETYNYISAAAGTTSTINSSKIKTAANAMSFTVPSRTAQKINVRIWLEGEDVECTDATAAGGKLTVNLVFTTKAS